MRGYIGVDGGDRRKGGIPVRSDDLRGCCRLDSLSAEPWDGSNRQRRAQFVDALIVRDYGEGRFRVVNPGDRQS